MNEKLEAGLSDSVHRPPYGIPPEGVNDQDIQRYHANYLEASAVTGAPDETPMDELVRRETRVYLAAHFDARGLVEIGQDIRAVLASQIARR